MLAAENEAGPPKAIATDYSATESQGRRWRKDGESVAGRRRAIAIDSLIPCAETVPVILNEGGFDGRTAEAWMPVDVRGQAGIDVAACGNDTVVIGLLGYLGEFRGRRRGLIDNHGAMRATSQGKRCKQYCKQKNLFHGEPLGFGYDCRANCRRRSPMQTRGEGKSCKATFEIVRNHTN